MDQEILVERGGTTPNPSLTYLAWRKQGAHKAQRNYIQNRRKCKGGQGRGEQINKGKGRGKWYDSSARLLKGYNDGVKLMRALAIEVVSQQTTRS